MSEENVAIMRTLFERFNRDGFLPVELWHSDAVLVNIRESPIPGPYLGHDGLRRFSFEIFRPGIRTRSNFPVGRRAAEALRQTDPCVPLDASS